MADLNRELRSAPIIGLLVGDASGAVLEFSPEIITPAMADWALKMPGGGCWKVGPGQITDDGELALCLVQALRKFDPLSFDPQALAQETAKWYRKWYHSQPFDIGQTIGRAFGFAGADANDKAVHDMMKRSADRMSQANGGLMRIAPLACWLAAVDDASKVVQCARNDAQLSHANTICQDCNVAYCLAIWHLVRNAGDAAGALKIASDWIQANATLDVKEWFKLAQGDDIASLDMTVDIGHVKWAFVLSFYHLRLSTSFKGGLKATLLKGGDTDTNAAIVGAMLGALHGRVPKELTGAVLSYSAGAGNSRPDFLTPSCVLEGGHAF